MSSLHWGTSLFWDTKIVKFLQCKLCQIYQLRTTSSSSTTWRNFQAAMNLLWETTEQKLELISKKMFLSVLYEASVPIWRRVSKLQILCPAISKKLPSSVMCHWAWSGVLEQSCCCLYLYDSWVQVEFTTDPTVHDQASCGCGNWDATTEFILQEQMKVGLIPSSCLRAFAAIRLLATALPDVGLQVSWNQSPLPHTPSVYSWFWCYDEVIKTAITK